jgi:2'-5' RNA ligase
MKPGIVILSELHGELRNKILDIQRRFDPKLAAGLPPHLTLTGSSGMGPIPPKTPVAELRRALELVARETAPMTLPFLAPMRFMQTNVVVLPLDPNGPIRALHERILRSGLPYERPRFTFTPHVTLSFFRTLEPAQIRELLKVQMTEPLTLDRISAHRTVDSVTTEKILELPLTGAGGADTTQTAR